MQGRPHPCEAAPALDLPATMGADGEWRYTRKDGTPP